MGLEWAWEVGSAAFPEGSRCPEGAWCPESTAGPSDGIRRPAHDKGERRDDEAAAGGAVAGASAGTSAGIARVPHCGHGEQRVRPWRDTVVLQMASRA